MSYPYDFEVDCEVTFFSSTVVEEAYKGRDQMSLFACALLRADAEEKIEDGWTWLPGVIGELICRNIAEHYLDFAYGNVKLHNPMLTREMAQDAADHNDGVVRSDT